MSLRECAAPVYCNFFLEGFVCSISPRPKKKENNNNNNNNNRLPGIIGFAKHNNTTILICHQSAGRLPSKMSGPSHSAPRRRRAAGCVPSDNGHMLKSKGALLHVIGACRQLQPTPQVFSVGEQWATNNTARLLDINLLCLQATYLCAFIFWLSLFPAALMPALDLLK